MRGAAHRTTPEARSEAIPGRAYRFPTTGAELVNMCPFCRLITEGELAIETEHAVAFADAFPVSPGHMLIVPRRHEADLFALEDAERAACGRWCQT